VFSHGGRRANRREAVEWRGGLKLGAARSCSRRWIATEPSTATTSSLLEAVTSAVRVRSFGPRRRRGGAHVRRADDRRGGGGPPASIFHFGEVSIAGVKTELARRGLEVRL